MIIEYIFDLPNSARRELCQEIDALNVWPKIAEAVKLYPAQIQKIKSEELRGNSPTKELLIIWGDQYNHKLIELLIVLKRLKLFSVLPLLRDYVDPKYYRLLLDKAQPNSQKPPATVGATVKLLNDAQSVSNKTTTENISTSLSTPSGYLNEHKMREIAKAVLEIDYEELRQATSNWSPENVLGKGGFGIVYRGCWKHTDVAIKVMDYRRPNGSDNSHQQNVKVEMQQSLNELKHLHACRHDNILALYGYSIKGKKPCLVYQLMKGGSLESRLSDTSKAGPLTWQQRYSICVGTARGIYFLHNSRDKPLIHGDIKPANILLDQSLQPKIGDFGLVRVGPQTINSAIVVSQVFGTKAYLPPEFIKHKELSVKVDTYSYGIVLMETYTGRRAFRTGNLPHTVYDLFNSSPSGELYDARLQKPAAGPELDMCNSIIVIALECTADSASLRPDMGALLDRLDAFKSLLL